MISYDIHYGYDDGGEDGEILSRVYFTSSYDKAYSYVCFLCGCIVYSTESLNVFHFTNKDGYNIVVTIEEIDDPYHIKRAIRFEQDDKELYSFSQVSDYVYEVKCVYSSNDLSETDSD